MDPQRDPEMVPLLLDFKARLEVLHVEAQAPVQAANDALYAEMKAQIAAQSAETERKWAEERAHETVDVRVVELAEERVGHALRESDRVLTGEA